MHGRIGGGNRRRAWWLRSPTSNNVDYVNYTRIPSTSTYIPYQLLVRKMLYPHQTQTTTKKKKAMMMIRIRSSYLVLFIYLHISLFPTIPLCGVIHERTNDTFVVRNGMTADIIINSIFIVRVIVTRVSCPIKFFSIIFLKHQRLEPLTKENGECTAENKIFEV